MGFFFCFFLGGCLFVCLFVCLFLGGQLMMYSSAGILFESFLQEIPDESSPVSPTTQSVKGLNGTECILRRGQRTCTLHRDLLFDWAITQDLLS